MPDRVADADSVADADGRTGSDRDRGPARERPPAESHPVAAAHAETHADADGNPHAGADAKPDACSHAARAGIESPSPHAAVRRTADPRSAPHRDAGRRYAGAGGVTVEFTAPNVEFAESGGVTETVAMCLGASVEADPL